MYITCKKIFAHTSIDNKSDFLWCRNLKVLPCGQFHTPGWVEIDGCLSSYRSSWWSCTCAIWCDHWSCLGEKSKLMIFGVLSLFVEPSFDYQKEPFWIVVFWGMRMHKASESLGKFFFIWSDSCKVAICTTCWTSWSPCAWIGDILWPIGSWWKGYHLTEGGGGNSWTPW